MEGRGYVGFLGFALGIWVEGWIGSSLSFWVFVVLFVFYFRAIVRAVILLYFGLWVVGGRGSVI